MEWTPYAAAVRLYFICGERWPEIDAFYPNTDLLRLPTHQFLNYVYAWCLTQIDPEKREEWIRDLNEPFPGQEPTPQQVEREMDDFTTVMGMLGGGL